MTEPPDIPDADPTWRELRTLGREYVEGQLATARMLAMHARSKREREYHSKRVRRLVEVLEGMDGP